MLKKTYRQYRPLFDVVLFVLITYTAHKIWWGNIHHFESWSCFASCRYFLKNLVFENSLWFIKKLFTNTTVYENTFVFANNGFIKIDESCAGLKQFYQLSLLILLFPGPPVKKLWYLPLGILIMHATNIFRILVLSVIIIEVPAVWRFSHDWILRPFFYVAIFGIWWFWNEKMREKDG